MIKPGPNDKSVRLLAAAGLALGGILGMTGTLVASSAMRGLAWGIDGVALVVASALLVVHYVRQGKDLVAAGFIVFAVGEGLIVSGAALDPVASAPAFGAGTGLWAAALLLISVPGVFPAPVRIVGTIAAVLFAATAVQIFWGLPLHPTSTPLPFFAYPVLVATFIGWIWVLLKSRPAWNPEI